MRRSRVSNHDDANLLRETTFCEHPSATPIRSNKMNLALVAALTAFPLGALCAQPTHDPMKPSQICGSDPRILTDINFITFVSGRSKISNKVDVKFDTKINPPCALNLCSVKIKDGTTGKIFDTIEIDSDNIAFCRGTDPFLRFHGFPSNEPKIGCNSTLFTTLRRIVWIDGNQAVEHLGAKSFLIERGQNRYRVGTNAFNCLPRSAGEDAIGSEKLKILETSLGSQLSILNWIDQGKNLSPIH